MTPFVYDPKAEKIELLESVLRNVRHMPTEAFPRETSRIEQETELAFRIAALKGDVRFHRCLETDGRNPVTFPRIWRFLLRRNALVGVAHAFRYY